MARAAVIDDKIAGRQVAVFQIQAVFEQADGFGQADGQPQALVGRQRHVRVVVLVRRWVFQSSQVRPSTNGQIWPGSARPGTWRGAPQQAGTAHWDKPAHSHRMRCCVRAFEGEALQDVLRTAAIAEGMAESSLPVQNPADGPSAGPEGSCRC